MHSTISELQCWMNEGALVYSNSLCFKDLNYYKVCVPKTTTEHKTNTMYHIHTFGST